MISLKHNFLFIHIPKTAGNSIQTVLKQYSEDKIFCLNHHQDGVERFEISSQFSTSKHSTLREYADKLSKDQFNSLFKFTCIRNPWERAISFYFSPHRGRHILWNKADFLFFLDTIRPSSYYLSLDPNESNHAFDYVDFFLRYENLDQDFKNLCNKLNIPFSSLPRRNASRHRHYSAYYDDELVEYVRQKFDEEISVFNYDFTRQSDFEYTQISTNLQSAEIGKKSQVDITLKMQLDEQLKHRIDALNQELACQDEEIKQLKINLESVQENKEKLQGEILDLKHELKKKDGDFQIRQEHLLHEIQNTSSELLHISEKYNRVKRKLKRVLKRQGKLEARLSVAYSENLLLKSELELFRSSKFWKLRSVWLRCKRALGFKAD